MLGGKFQVSIGYGTLRSHLRARQAATSVIFQHASLSYMPWHTRLCKHLRMALQCACIQSFDVSNVLRCLRCRQYYLFIACPCRYQLLPESGQFTSADRSQVTFRTVTSSPNISTSCTSFSHGPHTYVPSHCIGLADYNVLDNYSQ